jgi:hypothetical protein
MASNPFTIVLPHIDTPQDILTRRLTVQNLMAQAQERQQQAQINAIKVQEAQATLQGQQTAMQTMQQWSMDHPGQKPDFDDDLIPAFQKAGVPLPVLNDLQAQHLKNVQAARDAALTQETALKTQNDNRIARNNIIGGAIQQALTAPDNVKDDVWASFANDKDLQAALKANNIPFPAQRPSDDQLHALAGRVGYQQKIDEDAKNYAALQTQARSTAIQQLGSVNDQASFDNWVKNNPKAAAVMGAPTTFDRDWVNNQIVGGAPIDKRREVMMQLGMTPQTPQDLQQQLTSITDPNIRARTIMGMKNATKPEEMQRALEAGITAQNTLDREQGPGAITAAANKAAAEEAARQGQMGQQLYVPDGQGNYTLTRLKPGQTMPQGAISPSTFNRIAFAQSNPQVMKVYQPALDSAERFNIMADNYTKAVKDNDQQAMLSLLAQHLGMTMGTIKGGRMNQAIINEAIKSRPWLQGIESKFDSNGYLSGVTLTKPQMKQMLDLGRERFKQDLQQSQSKAGYIGAKPEEGPKRLPNEAVVKYYKALANGDTDQAKQLAKEDGWTVE